MSRDDLKFVAKGTLVVYLFCCLLLSGLYYLTPENEPMSQMTVGEWSTVIGVLFLLSVFQGGGFALWSKYERIGEV